MDVAQLIEVASKVCDRLRDDGAIAAWCGTWEGLGLGRDAERAWIERMQAARALASHEECPGSVDMWADMTLAVVCVTNVSQHVIDEGEEGGFARMSEGVCVVTVWPRESAPTMEENARRAYEAVRFALREAT